MTHDQVVAEIQERARSAGILTHYCHLSKLCLGDRGLPDLFLAGPFGAAWIEVKTPESPRLDSEQVTWKYVLCAAGQLYYKVTPESLSDDTVTNILMLIGGPQ